VAIIGPGGIPRTVSSIPAVPSSINASAEYVFLSFNMSAIGPRIGLQWNNMTTGPDTYGGNMSPQPIEVMRATGVPFRPVISTPAGSPSTAHIFFTSRGGVHGWPYALYSDHSLSQWKPSLTMVDLYGPTLTEDGTVGSYFGPFAGETIQHRAHYGAWAIDEQMMRSTNLNTVKSPRRRRRKIRRLPNVGSRPLRLTAWRSRAMQRAA
jgi:hypothetical protein